MFLDFSSYSKSYKQNRLPEYDLKCLCSFLDLCLSRLESKVSGLSCGNDESSEIRDPDNVEALMESLKYQQEVVELERKVSLYNGYNIYRGY